MSKESKQTTWVPRYKKDGEKWKDIAPDEVFTDFDDARYVVEEMMSRYPEYDYDLKMIEK